MGRPKKPIIVFVLALLAGLYLARHVIAEWTLIGGVKALTGLGLQVKKVRTGLLETWVRMDGLKLLNPSGFPDRVMMEIEELYVDYDLLALLKGTTHLERVRFHLKEFVVEKDKEGRLNLEAFQFLQKQKGSPPPVKARDGPKLQIDVLELKIGKVLYKDYSNGPNPLIRVFDVSINERYERITNPQALASLILLKALTHTTISHLADFDLKPLQGLAADALNKATGMALGAVGGAVETGTEVGTQTLDRLKSLIPSDQ